MNTYLEWAKRHAATFGLTRPQDEDLVLGWAAAFARSGWSVEELQDATAFLATRAPPRFREDHLAALVARLRWARQRLDANGQRVEESRCPDCRRCGGSGRCSVPSRPQMRRGPWRGGTEAVYCVCAAGDHARMRGAPGDNLDVYERDVPG